MLLAMRAMLVEADNLSGCGTIRLIETPEAGIPDAIINLLCTTFLHPPDKEDDHLKITLDRSPCQYGDIYKTLEGR